MVIGLVLLLLFSLALIGAPIGLSIAGFSLSAISSIIMTASGITLAVVSVILLTITKLYVKTKASEAFVRTGMGGLKVIRDGGAIVLPVIHQIVRVSLETIRVEVKREASDALITNDKLRADIKAEFFVRIEPKDESIQAAARSLGEKMNDAGNANRGHAVGTLIEDKLVSALRTAAARKTLEQLNSERDEFLKEVQGFVESDLTHNGFILETVTISKLDQTDEVHLKDNNIFDAQGMRKVAEITQQNLTEKNRIIREGEQARTAQDVETRKLVLELEQNRSGAEATQAANVAAIQAEQTKITKEKQIAATRAVEIAEVERKKQIEVALRQQQRDVEIAEREKQKAVVAAEQGVEVAKRAQQEAIANAEAQRVVAEAKLAESEAERQKARQLVITTEEIAAADREKQKAVIAAEAEAEKIYVQTQKSADGEAYKVKAQADARKASADAEAEALRKKADAEATAQKLSAEGNKAVAVAEAEGKKAIDMVPIEVKAREVEVEKRRVEDVLKPELEARSTFGKAAQDFELAKFRIEKEAEVRIAAANATVNLYNKIEAKIFGTPEDAAKMAKSFRNGMGIAETIDGFMEADNSSIASLAKTVAGTLESALLSKNEKSTTSENGAS